ncbi:hypothetical protein CASFOL_016178 [Castilleja foliolosa]|uniref:Uncharacterized protein n=1 Tax=Castilleja foliolosa TaxID=1961234 RepID=A0ABD3DFU9_9LAMI
MERREGRKGQLPVDPCRELERCGKGNTLFDMELQAYQRLFTEDENMDENYKILLTTLFSKEKKIILSQKMKPDDKPNLPLLPTMKLKNSEQLVRRRGQYFNGPGDDARREFGRVLIQNDKDDVAFKERCKLNKKRAGFEVPKKQKGKGLLIHYVDVDVHEVVGKGNKKQNGKERLVEPGDVREDSEKTKFELEKKRKGKGLLVEPDDYDVGENDAEALKERSKRSDRYNVVCENGKDRLIKPGDAREDSEKTTVELEKKRKGKGLLVEPDDHDVGENEAEALKERSKRSDSYNAVCGNGKERLIEPGDDARDDPEKKTFELEKKRKGKGLLVEPDDHDVGENDAEALKERSKRSDRYNAVCENGKERLIEPGDAREDPEKTTSELEKKRKGKGLLVEPDDHDVGENDAEALKERSKRADRYNVVCENGKERLIEPGDAQEDPEKTTFELEKKRKGKGLLVEPDDHDVGENDDEALKERSKRSDRYNAVCENDGKTSKEKSEQDSGYEIFLKLMEEYKQAKNEAICKNAATVKTEEGIGFNKDNEPEPKRDVELLNEVPNIVKKPNVEKSRNAEKVQEGTEKRSSHRSGNEGEDKNAEIEKLPARRSRKVVFGKYSSGEDKDRREEIEKSPSREYGNEKAKKKRAEADIEKRSPRRSGKVEGIAIKKRLAYQSREAILKESREEYKREEIEKHSSRDFRNIAVKKSKNDKAGADIEKSSSRRSRKFIYKESSDEDERVEFEKHSSREFRNVTTKKQKKQNAEPDFVKRSCRQSREIVYKDYSSDEDEDEDVGIEKRPDRRSMKTLLEKLSNRDVREEMIKKRMSREDRNISMEKPKNKKVVTEIEKCSSRRPRKVVYSSDEDESVDLKIKKRPGCQLREAVLENSSDDGNAEIEKHSSHEFRNVPMKKPKDEKLTTEMDKRAAHEYRKVVMKRPRGEEDVEEEVKRFRDFLLMRSRYEVEEEAPQGDMNFRVGESSVHLKKKIDEDSSEENEMSSDSDSDVEILGRDECLKGPFVPSTRFRNTDVLNYRLSDEYIEFRRQALEAISKPYDKSEYKDLLAEFKGRCYPGYHQDLVEKLKENRWNPRKRLAILRGFFFWLQNLTRVGSFKPWHDDVCLRVEPVRLPKNNGPW